MKQNKTKIVVSAVVAIVICVSLIAGSTFALFTSESSVNVAVTSGKVDVVANVDVNSVSLTSMGQAVSGKWTNGGTAGFNEKKEFVLNGITPGDAATFNIVATNNSTVDVQYCVRYSVNGELASVLSVSADALVGVWQKWTVPASQSDKVKNIAVTVSLPDTVGNDYQDKSASVIVTVEAVQGNAAVQKVVSVSSAAELETAFTQLCTEGAEATEIILANDIVLSQEAYLNQAKAPVTINGNGHTVSAAADFGDIGEGQWQLMKIDNTKQAIVVKDITLQHGYVPQAINGSAGSHTLDIWGASNVVLQDVTLIRSNAEGKWGAPLVVNNSKVTVLGQLAMRTGGVREYYGANVQEGTLDVRNAVVSYSEANALASCAIYAEQGGTVLCNEGQFNVVESGAVVAYQVAAASKDDQVYYSLAEAITSAQAGDVIEVKNGKHLLNSIAIAADNVTIKGESSDAVIFNTPIAVSGNGVTMENLSVKLDKIITENVTSPIQVDGSNFVMKNCVVERTTEKAQPCGMLVAANDGFTVTGCTFIAPFDPAAAFGASPSVIEAKGGIDMDDCTIATDGYGLFSQHVTTGTIKNTVFTGIDGRPTLGCINSTVLNGLVFDGCTFDMGRNSLVTAGSYTMQNCVFNFDSNGGASNGINVYANSGSIVIKNNVFNLKDGIKGINFTSATWATGDHNGAHIIVTGNTFNNVGSCAVRVTSVWTGFASDYFAANNTLNGNAVISE